MDIGGFQNLSLVDYPEKLSCIIWTRGCNFRCPFCYNKELVLFDKRKDSANKTESIFSFLKKRKGLLQGVVLTGGEPLLQKDIEDFIKKIKKLGYAVKLDTNGSFPDRLEKLIQKNLIDYVAMDIKASLENYPQATGVKVNIENIKKSIELIKALENYEFRTTAVPGIVDEKEIRKIGKLAKGAKKFVLQQFEPRNTLDKSYEKKKPYPTAKLKEFQKILEQYVDQCIASF